MWPLCFPLDVMCCSPAAEPTSPTMRTLLCVVAAISTKWNEFWRFVAATAAALSAGPTSSGRHWRHRVTTGRLRAADELPQPATKAIATVEMTSKRRGRILDATSEHATRIFGLPTRPQA